MSRKEQDTKIIHRVLFFCSPKYRTLPPRTRSFVRCLFGLVPSYAASSDSFLRTLPLRTHSFVRCHFGPIPSYAASSGLFLRTLILPKSVAVLFYVFPEKAPWPCVLSYSYRSSMLRRIFCSYRSSMARRFFCSYRSFMARRFFCSYRSFMAKRVSCSFCSSMARRFFCSYRSSMLRRIFCCPGRTRTSAMLPTITGIIGGRCPRSTSSRTGT